MLWNLEQSNKAHGTKMQSDFFDYDKASEVQREIVCEVCDICSGVQVTDQTASWVYKEKEICECEEPHE